MNINNKACLIGAISLLVACSTPQDRASKAQQSAYEAQEEVAQQRLKLVEKYQTCVSSAGEDLKKAAACESYLKSAEALK